MPKPKRKVTTDEKSIAAAEEKLGFRYPAIIRDRLKKQNGFYWGPYRFYCVFDEEDRYHTFDDVVKENIDGDSSWRHFIPEGHVVIANEDLFCLTVMPNEDEVVCLYDHGTGEIKCMLLVVMN